MKAQKVQMQETIFGRSRRAMFRGMAMAGLLAVLLPSGAGCQKGSGDNSQELLSALLLMDLNGIFVRIVPREAQSNGLTFQPNRGDGPGDGYPDRFATPLSTDFYISRILLYRSPEKGGPVPGEETLENADMVLYECKFEGEDCYAHFSMDFAGSPTERIAEQGIPEGYDRIGVMPGNYTFRFSRGVMVDPNYRDLDIIFGPKESEFHDLDRLTISSMNYPSEDHSEQDLWYHRQSIHKDTGAYECWEEEGTKPCYSSQGTVSAADEWESPEFPGYRDDLPEDGYVMVFDIPEKKISKLTLNLHIEDLFFWDTNHPDRSSFDWRDDGPDGGDKDMELYLPEITTDVVAAEEEG